MWHTQHLAQNLGHCHRSMPPAETKCGYHHLATSMAQLFSHVAKETWETWVVHDEREDFWVEAQMVHAGSRPPGIRESSAVERQESARRPSRWYYQRNGVVHCVLWNAGVVLVCAELAEVVRVCRTV